MTQLIKGTGPQTFDLGTALNGNHGAGVRGSVIATMEAFATEFTSNKAANGWQKLPSGLILQWGVDTTGAGGVKTVTLPFSFPNAILFAVANADSITYQYANVSAFYLGTINVTVINSSTNTGSSSQFKYLVIGY